jgi:hypothetical protein
MSCLLYDFRSQLIEVEANPLIVCDDGAFAADALAVARAVPAA